MNYGKHDVISLDYEIVHTGTHYLVTMWGRGREPMWQRGHWAVW